MSSFKTDLLQILFQHEVGADSKILGSDERPHLQKYWKSFCNLDQKRIEIGNDQHTLPQETLPAVRTSNTRGKRSNRIACNPFAINPTKTVRGFDWRIMGSNSNQKLSFLWSSVKGFSSTFSTTVAVMTLFNPKHLHNFGFKILRYSIQPWPLSNIYYYCGC